MVDKMGKIGFIRRFELEKECYENVMILVMLSVVRMLVLMVFVSRVEVIMIVVISMMIVCLNFIV